MARRRQRVRSRRRGEWFVGSSNWGGNTVLSGATQVFSPLVKITPSAPNVDLGAVANVGQVTVSQVRGHIDFTPQIPPGAISVGNSTVGVGLFVSEYDSGSALFQGQVPTLPADANRDNWLYLDARTLWMGADLSSSQNAPCYQFHINLRRSIQIYEGQALYLVVSQAAGVGFTWLFGTYLRTMIVRTLA